MNILYISNTRHHEHPHKDASTRYRCYHFAEALREMGHIADVTAFHGLDPKILPRYDVLVFHRPTYSRKLARLLEKQRRSYQLIIADYDDLIFGEDNALESPLFRDGRASERIVRHLYEANTRALSLFDVFTLSTEPLKEELKRAHPTATAAVIHNGLSPYWVESNREYRNPGNHETRIITYLPGTPSHDRDFSTITDVLADYLHQHPDTRLRVVGKLTFDTSPFPKAQIEQLPHRPYLALPEVISDSWVNIAPLEENRFTHCKSGLKFFESAVFGTPVIATPIADIARFNCPGHFLPRSQQEWLEALEALEDTSACQAYSNSLPLYARKHCMAKQQAQRLSTLISEWSAQR